MSRRGVGGVVPVARYAAVALGGATAAVLIANPATRWYARLRRRDDPGYGADVPLLFDVNTEATIPTWWSAGLLLAVAGVCGLLVAVAVDGSSRRWAVLAAVFAGMSLDEAAALHERLDVGPGDGLRHPWVLAGVVLAAALAVAAGWAVVTLPRTLRRGVTLGLGIYLAGALGLEAASGAVLDAVGDGLAYAAVTWGEEAAEMAGAVVVCCALLAALEVRREPGALRLGLAPAGLTARPA